LDGAWFIWWHPISNWSISTEPGVGGAAFWCKMTGDIEGEYGPFGTAEGIALVTKGEH